MARACGKPDVELCDLPQILLIEILDSDHAVAGDPARRQQFVELQMKRHAVLVLTLLDEEDHQEGHDGGARVDDQLPVLGKMEQRSHHRPHEHGKKGQAKGQGRTRPSRDSAREVIEGRQKP